MKNENLEEKKDKKGVASFDIKAFFNNNKKAISVGAVAFILVVVVIVGATLLFGKSHALPNQEEVLENKMKELAKDFYENRYYPGLTDPKTNKPKSDDEKKDTVKKYKDTGITISLAAIVRLYSDEDKENILNEFKNEDKDCDYSKTNVVIYPKDPYTIDSYDVKVNLSCGFEENDK